MTRVLIAEDNPTLLESIAFELEMKGFDVLQAINGIEALALLKNSESYPDIIVSDIAMPEMDGYQLLAHVQQEDHLAGIPFIFLTAFGSKTDMRMGKELGVDDYLTKPFESEDLVIAIENKLNRISRFKEQADRQLNKVRLELLRVISHELRTPLTSIFGGTEMLEETIAQLSDDFAMKMLQLVKSGSLRLNRTVNNIICMVEVDSGSFASKLNRLKRPYLVRELIADAIVTVENDPDLSRREVAIQFAPHESDPEVFGVRDFLTLAFSEVIRNAVAFSSPGASVSVDVNVEGGLCELIVSDHGYGIPADCLDKVWERFVQIDRDEHEQQGMGIGLSLVHAIIHKHGGHSTIRSQQGVGTQVIISLPKFEAISDV